MSSGPSSPVRLDLRANRYTPFDRTIAIRGVDLNGAYLRMEIRPDPDAPGLPLALLVGAAPPAQGIRLVDVVTGVDGVPTSTIGIRVLPGDPPETNPAVPGMLSFPKAREIGDPVAFAYDLHIALFTPGVGTGDPAVWFAGAFIIEPGVTRYA